MLDECVSNEEINASAETAINHSSSSFWFLILIHIFYTIFSSSLFPTLAFRTATISSRLACMLSIWLNLTIKLIYCLFCIIGCSKNLNNYIKWLYAKSYSLTVLYSSTIFIILLLTMKAIPFLLCFSCPEYVSFYWKCPILVHFNLLMPQMSICNWFISSFTVLRYSTLVPLAFHVSVVILPQVQIFFPCMITSTKRCPKGFKGAT